MKLVRVGDYITEQTQRNKASEDIPVYSVTNTQGFCQDYFNKEVASKDRSTYKIVKKGWFAYNPSRINVGSIDWLKNNIAIVSPLYNVFSLSSEMDPDYLLYYLKSSVGLSLINATATGSVRNNLKFSMLANFYIPLPDLKMQKSIVSILKRIQSLIDTKRKQINLLDELVKARFVELFGDPINNNKQWPISTVGAIATDVKYGTSRPATKGGKFPYLRMNNLTYDGYLDLTDLKYIDIPDNEYEKCVVRRGDILFNRTNSVDLIGKTVAYDRPDEMIIAGYIIRVRLNDKLLPEVFSQYMNLEVMKKTLSSMAKGAVHQANINAQELKSIEVYLPEIGLQKEFVAFKQHIDKSKFVESLHLAKRKNGQYNKIGFLEVNTWDM